MSVQQTLACLFAALAAITCLQGGITYAELLQVRGGVGSIVDRHLPSVAALGDIDNAVERVRNRQLRLLLSEPDKGVIAYNVLDLDVAERDLSDAEAHYTPLISTADEGAVFDAFAKAWTKYATYTAPLRDLMATGRVRQADELLSSDTFRQLNLSIDAKLRQAAASHIDWTRLEAARSMDSMRAANLAITITVTVAALLALAAMVLCYGRVIRPLAAVTRVMRKLAAGDSEAEIHETHRGDEIGVMIAALLVFRDTLKRIRSTELARQQTQLLVENIAGTVPDGILALREDGTITFWNAAAERLLGFSAAEMTGRPLGKLHPLLKRSAAGQAFRVRSAVAEGAAEIQMTHRDGHTIPIEISVGRWLENGREAFCAVLRDIRSRKANEAALHRLAHVDALTGLPNRTAFSAKLNEALASGRPAAVLMADLDRFKQVNDALGHHVGDEVLRIAGRRLLDSVGTGDTVTRLGGDEFALLLPGVSDERQAAQAAETVLHSFLQPFVVQEQTIQLSGSVGIAFAPEHADSADLLLSSADMALYAAKADGRQCYRIFTDDLKQAAAIEVSCRREFRRAIDNEEFVLLYQPQVRLRDGVLIGAEALIRWQHPERGLLSPDKFITILENSQYAAEVGLWVIRTAARQAAAWRADWATDFRMGVNLSTALFRTDSFADEVFSILSETGLPPEALEVEITETIILSHDEALIRPLRRLKEAGIGVAFDDYGTGYASLSHLKRFPLTRLKIDRSFVRDMVTSGSDSAIIRAVLELGRSLQLCVIAEGIEREDQLAHLLQDGCDEGQGYLFGKPMGANAFSATLRAPAVEARVA